MVERVLDSCCGFLYNTEKTEEPAMVDRFFDDKAQYPDGNDSLRRRAFLITSDPVKDAVEVIPGQLYANTLTPWEPDKMKKGYPKNSHHVKSYTVFYSTLILNNSIHNIAGFDGDMGPRQEKFDQLMQKHPDKWRLCILSNDQHTMAEPFLVANGFRPVIRGRNNYWYNNHLTIFVHPPTAKAA